MENRRTSKKTFKRLVQLVCIIPVPLTFRHIFMTARHLLIFPAPPHAAPSLGNDRVGYRGLWVVVDGGWWFEPGSRGGGRGGGGGWNNKSGGWEREREQHVIMGYGLSVYSFVYSWSRK
ncbi:hypothetical protein OIU78_021942 [Salix suchowensis]|nr:hypothetical protein OIU78_021942 [Salix suchowensis]